MLLINNINNVLRFLKIRIQLIGFVFCLVFVTNLSTSAQDLKLKFSDLNVGIDYHNTSYQDSANPVRYYNQAIGLSGRYQTSVVANYLNKGKNKRFEIVDVIAGEMAFGVFESDDPSNKEPLWFAFRFDLGLGTVFRINKNQDIGVNWIMMRFANDFLSTYISGSEIQARYRYKKFSIELGTANRNVRIGGFSETYLKNKGEGNVTTFGFRYLMNEKRDMGVRIETFDLDELDFNDKFVNCRIFSGYYF